MNNPQHPTHAKQHAEAVREAVDRGRELLEQSLPFIREGLEYASSEMEARKLLDSITAYLDTIAGGEVAWSKEPPTEPGWYWVKGIGMWPMQCLGEGWLNTTDNLTYWTNSHMLNRGYMFGPRISPPPGRSE